MNLTGPFHPGELAVQTRVGEDRIAVRNGQTITDRIPNGALKFVDKQPMVVATTIDDQNRIWTSLLAGKPGFTLAESPSLVSLNPSLLASARDDIFWTNINRQPAVGLLFIELSSRRRLRVNGQIQTDGDNLLLTVGEAFPLCPRYIQKREITVTTPNGLADAPITTGTRLPPDLIRWIERADTFFVGSSHDNTHLDASHRGGKPGFVCAENDQTLLMPDYNGNSLFNTLGNLSINPLAGLLFVDFDAGETLQLSGTTDLLFDNPDGVDDTGGTGRHWRFHLTGWRRQASLRSVEWTFVEYSPFNV